MKLLTVSLLPAVLLGIALPSAMAMPNMPKKFPYKTWCPNQCRNVRWKAVRDCNVMKPHCGPASNRRRCVVQTCSRPYVKKAGWACGCPKLKAAAPKFGGCPNICRPHTKWGVQQARQECAQPNRRCRAGPTGKCSLLHCKTVKGAEGIKCGCPRYTADGSPHKDDDFHDHDAHDHGDHKPAVKGSHNPSAKKPMPKKPAEKHDHHNHDHHDHDGHDH